MEWGFENTIVTSIWVIIILCWIFLTGYIRIKTTNFVGLRRSVWLLIGLIGLGLLITRPKYEARFEEGRAILLTEGYNGPTKGKNTYSNIHSLLNSPLSNSVSTIQIRGFGLPADDFQLLKNYHLEFVPGTRITGVTSLQVPNITEGEEWELSGTFYGAGIEKVNLITPQGSSHEAILKDSLLEIKSTAPVAGDYVYQLQIIQNNADTLTESLPITIHHNADWNMLVLSSFPSFEINNLKNYWTEKGYGFGLRLKIAADKYFSSFVNIPTLNLERISQDEFKNFDFIMVDVASWNTLSNVERNRVLQLVSDDGMALLLRPDGSSSKAKGINHPSWTAPIEKAYASSSGIITYLEYPVSSSRWSSLKSTSFNLGVYRNVGLGHIFLIGFDDSYKLILSNEESMYQSIWSDLFSTLYRDFSPSSKLIHAEWLWEREPTKIYISTHKAINAPVHINDSIQTPLLQLPFINGFYEFTTWPEKGYNSVSISESNKELTFYAHPINTWKAIRQKMLSHETKKAVERSQQMSATSSGRMIEIPFYFWYLLLFFGFGALWLDETLFE